MRDDILDEPTNETRVDKNRLFAIIRWWEKRRLIYNGILLVFGLTLIVVDRWTFTELSTGDWAVGLTALVAGANLCYLFGWNFELLLAYYFGFYVDDFKRWVLWLAGIFFSLAILMVIYFVLVVNGVAAF